MNSPDTGPDPVPSAAGNSRPERRWRVTGRVLVALGIVIAAILLTRTLSRYSPAEIAASVRTIPTLDIARAVAFAAASYLCLTGFDVLALRYVGRPLPYRRAALASFVSLSLAHSIGVSGLSSGAIRYRFYARWGLSAAEVARLVLFCGATVVLGQVATGATALLVNPDGVARLTGFDRAAVRLAGCAGAGLVVAYLALSVAGARVSWRGIALAMPEPRLAFAQVALGAGNFACVAGCLHALLPASAEARLLDVAGAFVFGNFAGMVAHVPGGLGVIEWSVTALLGAAAPIGALLAFRAVYYLVPLGLGLLVLAIAEAAFRSRARRRRSRPPGSPDEVTDRTAPHLRP